MKTKLIIIISIMAVITIGFFALEPTAASMVCKERGGIPSGEVCIIENSAENSPEIKEPKAISLDDISFMKPNSMEFFYYPNPTDIENRDVFQKFILIRLPESLGGNVDDVSSFRAYSAVSLSDHCVIKYWPDEGRQRMENPCRGGMYRAIDGLLMYNVDPVRITSAMALPHLDLSIDENGFLFVDPPKWTLQENGVIGIGRQMSLPEIRQGSEILIDSFEKSHPRFPLIPLNFAGHTLSEIKPDGNRVVVNYFDFSSMSGSISFDVGLVTAQDQKYFLNFGKSYSEFWQIDDTTIKIGGNALEKNNDQPEWLKEYEIQFIKDGYNFRFGGKNLEFMKKEIVANYFSENEYDDLFLISKND